MEYGARDIAEFMLVREELSNSLREFRRNMCDETNDVLMNAIVKYEHIVPQSVIVAMVVRTGRDDLAQIARFHQERYYNACFANK